MLFILNILINPVTAKVAIPIYRDYAKIAKQNKYYIE